MQKVLEIDIQKEILRKEGEKRLSTLENDILKEREQNQADVDKYKKTQDAEANSALYTPDFIKLENIEIMKVSKLYVTEPVGMTKVNWFLNAAIIISTFYFILGKFLVNTLYMIFTGHQPKYTKV